MLAYPGALDPILDVLLLEGALDLGLMGLHTASTSGCLADSPSMNCNWKWIIDELLFIV